MENGEKLRNTDLNQQPTICFHTTTTTTTTTTTSWNNDKSTCSHPSTEEADGCVELRYRHPTSLTTSLALLWSQVAKQPHGRQEYQWEWRDPISRCYRQGCDAQFILCNNKMKLLTTLEHSIIDWIQHRDPSFKLEDRGPSRFWKGDFDSSVRRHP